MNNSHHPVIPDDDNPGLFQALYRFVPMILIYSLRHLTVGAFVRIKLKGLEQKEEKWIVEDHLT